MTGENRVATGLVPVYQQQWPDDTVPLVSVLVPAYNQERYIAQCLENILKQLTDFPLEIIVHDDASSDRTAKVIQAYAEAFPKIVRPVLQTENQHSLLRKVRPIMQGLARGEFLAACDGDDYWTDMEKLAKQVGFLRANPAYVLSFHDAMNIDPSGRVIRQENLLPRGRRDYTQAELRELKWGWMLMGTVVFRNVQLEFPPEFNLIPNGDNFIPMLFASFGGAKFQPEVGPLAYRRHAQSMWSSKSEQTQTRMHLQSYLQIAAYFVRIGEVETARKILKGRLARYARAFSA